MFSQVVLPDPDAAPEADVVIYDGQCRFCASQVGTLHRLDVGRQRLAFLSLHDARVAQRYPDLRHEQLMEQMYVIDREGRRHAGADAVRYLSRRLPMLWIAAPILHLPGSTGIWRWMYRQVAKRRYQLAGKLGPKCEGDACSVHFSKAGSSGVAPGSKDPSVEAKASQQ